MSGYFHVRNFERFQHYKDRNPPWIRLYGALWRDRAFFRLPDQAKAHLIGLFTIAARLDNRIPEDPEWLAHELCASCPIDIQALVDAGFLVREPASDPLAARAGRASGSVSASASEDAFDCRSEGQPEPSGASPPAADQLPLAFAGSVPEHAAPADAADGGRRARSWPADLALSENMRAFARRLGIEPDSEFEAWRDDCAAHNRRYADWSAAWRNRCRNALRFRARAAPAPSTAAEAPIETALRRLREAAQRERLREVS
jgi:hypothetical protein